MAASQRFLLKLPPKIDPKSTEMSLQHEFRKLLWKFGYDISRFTATSHPLARKKKILETYGIEAVLDVGANTGQFAIRLRKDLGYQGRIFSFEPLSSAFRTLQRNAEGSVGWEVFNCALGDANEKQQINIAGNSESSSLLAMLPSHQKAAPESGYVGTETIDVKTLDSLFGGFCKPSASFFLKIDTQGFEIKVLAGAEKSLPKIDTIQMEMSLVPLYGGELLFTDICVLMRNKGYTLVAIEDGFSDPASGQMLQVDGIFHRF